MNLGLLAFNQELFIFAGPSYGGRLSVAKQLERDVPIVLFALLTYEYPHVYVVLIQYHALLPQQVGSETVWIFRIPRIRNMIQG